MSVRPRVVGNCAVSVDGKLAYAGGARAHLSGPEDLARVQRLRADSQAILVGVGTVLLDDPSLRVHWELLDGPRGREPLRVVLDSHGRVPAGARVLDARQPTLVATASGCTRTYPAAVERFSAGADAVDLPALLDHLGARGVGQVLVEGGARVFASFLRSGLLDELTVYTAPVLIGGRTAPSLLAGPETPSAAEAVELEREEVDALGAGTLARYRRPGPPRAPL